MTASIVPPTAPTIMVTMVSSMVSARARRVSGLNMYSPTVAQSTLGLLMNE